MTHTQLAVILLMLLALAIAAVIWLWDANENLRRDLASMRERKALVNALGEPSQSTRRVGRL